MKPAKLIDLLGAINGDKHALLSALHAPWATMQDDIHDAESIMRAEATKSATHTLRLFARYEKTATGVNVKFADWIDHIHEHFRNKYGPVAGDAVAGRTVAIVVSRFIIQNKS